MASRNVDIAEIIIVLFIGAAFCNYIQKISSERAFTKTFGI